MAQIIVSYRTDENKWLADRLHDRLREKFGTANVVFGVQQMVTPEGEQPTTTTIETKVRKAAVLLILMGREWLHGDWFNDPENPDRVAILTALRDDIRIVPLLLNDAELPTSSELPREIARLGRRIPLTMSDDTFDEDAQDLFESLERYMNAPAQPDVAFTPPGQKPKRAVSIPASGRGSDASGTWDYENTSGAFSIPLPQSNQPLFIRAIAYPFSDPKWVAKMAIGVIAAIIPIVGALTLTGYSVRMAQRIRQGEGGLPEWDDFGGDLIRGFVTGVGSFLQALIWFIPLFIVLMIILSIGQTSYYSEVQETIIYQPNPFSMFVAVIIGLVVGVFALLLNMTAIANYLDDEKFSVFFEFNRLIREVTTNYKRNLVFIGNVVVLQLIIGALALFGTYLCLIPGLIISVIGSLGYYYIIADWAAKINGAAPPNVDDFDIPRKPKRGQDNLDW